MKKTLKEVVAKVLATSKKPMNLDQVWSKLPAIVRIDTAKKSVSSILGKHFKKVQSYTLYK